MKGDSTRRHHVRRSPSLCRLCTCAPNTEGGRFRTPKEGDRARSPLASPSIKRLTRSGGHLGRRIGFSYNYLILEIKKLTKYIYFT